MPENKWPLGRAMIVLEKVDSDLPWGITNIPHGCGSQEPGET